MVIPIERPSSLVSGWKRRAKGLQFPCGSFFYAVAALLSDLSQSSQARASRHQYVEHTGGDGSEVFQAVCKLGLEGIVSKKLNAPYRSGQTKSWIKVKNPNSPAATRALDGTL